MGAASSVMGSGATDRLERILERLRGRDEEAREQAAEDLDAMAREGLGIDEGVRVLEASIGRFPSRRFDIQDSSVDLIRAVAQSPRAEYVPVVLRLFRRLNPKAKQAALELLARVEDRAAAEGLMSLIRANARPGRLRSMPIPFMIERPFHPDVFFPELFEYVEVSDLTWPICELALGWIERGALMPGDVARDAPLLLRAYVKRRDRVMLAEKGGYAGDEDLAIVRRETGLLLDLLGNVPTPAVQAELRRALEFEDVKLKYFAVVSLLRLGRLVEPVHIRAVAANAEMRWWLWDELGRLGLQSMFPAEFRTMEAFAEADLVRWLAYPTELGCVPDEIGFVQVISAPLDEQGTMLDWYTFRFRLAEPHWAARDGWLAGVAGPWLRGSSPGTAALGEAFSRFEPWSRRTAPDHVGDLTVLVREYREKLGL